MSRVLPGASIRATPWDLIPLDLGSFGVLVARGSGTGAADLTVQTELHQLVTRIFLIMGTLVKSRDHTLSLIHI